MVSLIKSKKNVLQMREMVSLFKSKKNVLQMREMVSLFNLYGEWLTCTSDEGYGQSLNRCRMYG